jgi:hypothetical protein
VTHIASRSYARPSHNPDLIAAQIEAIRDVLARTPDRRDLSEASDGPGEQVIADVDLLAMADEGEARETRWRETEL